MISNYQLKTVEFYEYRKEIFFVYLTKRFPVISRRNAFSSAQWNYEKGKESSNRSSPVLSSYSSTDIANYLKHLAVTGLRTRVICSEKALQGTG